MRILVLDDQRSARVLLRRMLGVLADVEVVEAGNLDEAKAAIEGQVLDLLLLDIRLRERVPDRGGIELLEWLRDTGRATPAVIVTASTELVEIRDAMRLGAQDYVLKDELCEEMLLPIVEGVRERISLRRTVQQLRVRVDQTWGLGAVLGESPQMAAVRDIIVRVADADAPVLLTGETGTGKGLIARAIHEVSGRAAEPFMAVDCSAMPAQLIESSIFGHERGAFTGADRRVRGQLELAGGGSVLLDEIAEMGVDLQAKLLRVIEEKSFRPLGSETSRRLRARVLAATHVDLEQRMRQGRFREDLYYRLNVVRIALPPLNERPGDIPDLMEAFLREMPRQLRFDADAVEWLCRRRWPGNVRQLRNAVDRVSLLSREDHITTATLQQFVGEEGGLEVDAIDRIAKAILALPDRRGSKLEAVERAVLHHAIETCEGNKSAAARLIGVHRKSLVRKWVRLSGDEEEPQDED